MNLSLLAKWRWRILQSGPSLWKEILITKYGETIKSCLDLERGRYPSNASRWWKDLCSLDSVVESKKWLAESISRKVGNGETTSFWLDKWVGNSTLASLFPRLFSISIDKQSMVSDLGECVNGAWQWNLIWRRRIFEWEKELVEQLFQLLHTAVLSENSDCWVWKPGEGGSFSVRSAYLVLEEELSVQVNCDVQETRTLHQLWSSPAPSKVIAFSWKLLLNSIPTRQNLAHRGVLQQMDSKLCAICVGVDESSVHLFLHCDFASCIWYEIFRWLGLVIVLPANLFQCFDSFIGAAVGKKCRKMFRMIWHTIVWLIWKNRNDVIFSNSSKEVNEVVDDIKQLSWRWSLSRSKINPCMFYEWCMEPLYCFRS
ncbi:unnamed protein product [Trifolium pratense]|uniref:Uncharacterized protein n=1 Tax=Trifolium pratense TaxID=57577 RepID=A0ACB0M0H1_TRIPR|nr:unnamed protein product [Trifolium pratense]